MKKRLIFSTEGIVILFLIIIILSLILMPYLNNEKNSHLRRADLFEGKITNIKTFPGNLSGIGIYDKTCKKIGNELTRCDAGIKTKKYGVLNFNYIHNMEIKPCITSGNELYIDILDSNGTAKVWRINK